MKARFALVFLVAVLALVSAAGLVEASTTPAPTVDPSCCDAAKGLLRKYLPCAVTPRNQGRLKALFYELGAYGKPCAAYVQKARNVWQTGKRLCQRITVSMCNGH